MEMLAVLPTNNAQSLSVFRMNNPASLAQPHGKKNDTRTKNQNMKVDGAFYICC